MDCKTGRPRWLRDKLVQCRNPGGCRPWPAYPDALVTYAGPMGPGFLLFFPRIG